MSAPVKHTCPDIDAVIKRLKDAVKYCQGIEDEKLARDITWEIEYVFDDLENLRESNALLREWGENLEHQLREKEDEIYFLEEELKKIA